MDQTLTGEQSGWTKLLQESRVGGPNPYRRADWVDQTLTGEQSRWNIPLQESRVGGPNPYRRAEWVDQTLTGEQGVWTKPLSESRVGGSNPYRIAEWMDQTLTGEHNGWMKPLQESRAGGQNPKYRYYMPNTTTRIEDLHGEKVSKMMNISGEVLFNSNSIVKSTSFLLHNPTKIGPVFSL